MDNLPKMSESAVHAGFPSPAQDYMSVGIDLNKELVRHDIGVSALFESGITLEEYFKSLVGGNE